MLARSMNRTLSIVGAGRVGRTLGKRLRERGWRIGAVVTRSAATSRAAVRAIGAGTACVFALLQKSHRRGRAGFQPRRKSHLTSGVLTPEAKVLFAADLVLVTTADDATPGVAKSLAEFGGTSWRGKIVLHTSATLDHSVLTPLARLGAATGSLHPMQAFGGKVIPELSGVVFTVEGDPKA